MKFDFLTKELVTTFDWNNIQCNRSDVKEEFYKGRKYHIYGTEAAVCFVGNVYKVYMPSVESYKYVLVVGKAYQDIYDAQSISYDALLEEAAINAQIEPFFRMEYETEFNMGMFSKLCDVFRKSYDIPFILTDEEKED